MIANPEDKALLATTLMGLSALGFIINRKPKKLGKDQLLKLGIETLNTAIIMMVFQTKCEKSPESISCEEDVEYQAEKSKHQTLNKKRKILIYQDALKKCGIAATNLEII